MKTPNKRMETNYTSLLCSPDSRRTFKFKNTKGMKNGCRSQEAPRQPTVS